MEIKATELESSIIEIPITLLTSESSDKNSVSAISEAIEDKMYFNYEGIMPFYCKYRGMALENVESIIKLIQHPEESYVFWGDSSLRKAADYGGIPKLILCFDTKKCKRSYKEIEAAKYSGSEVDQLKKEYARCLESKDKTRLFFSHFKYDMNNVNYEINYGNYIPEKVGEALKRLIVFGCKGDQELIENLKLLGVKVDSNGVSS